MSNRIARFAVLLLPLLCNVAAACPFCKDATASGSGPPMPGEPDGGSVPGGLFNASVLYMLGGFLVVLGFMIAKIVSAIRSADRAQTNPAPSVTPR